MGGGDESSASGAEAMQSLRERNKKLPPNSR